MKQLTDDVVLPLMKVHNIEREEAEARLQLLFKSGILSTGHPDEPETQRMIDDFLALPSEQALIKVELEMTINQCLSSPEFLRQYDRLTFTNFSKALKLAQKGRPPKNFEAQFAKFSTHVQETVFAVYMSNKYK